MASLVRLLLAGLALECWNCVAGVGRWVLRRLGLVGVGSGVKPVRLIWRETGIQSKRGELLLSNWHGRSCLTTSANSGRKISVNTSQ